MPTRKYATNAERQAAYRVRRDAARASGSARPRRSPRRQSLSAWARSALTVPAGHPRAGERWRLARWQTAFLADVQRESTREAALIVARKNGKSALVAVLVLAHLAGPLKRSGWRCGILSLTCEDAGGQDCRTPA